MSVQSENIKIQVATVFPGSRKEEIEIRGRDMVSGLPRTITVILRKSEKHFVNLVAVIVQAAKKCA